MLPIFRPYCDFLTFPNMSYHPSELVQAYHKNFSIPWNAQKLVKHGLQTWSKPIMENLKVPCNAQKLAEHLLT